MTDPETKKLHAVSLSDASHPKTLMSIDLPQVPNELSGVSSANARPYLRNPTRKKLESPSPDT